MVDWSLHFSASKSSLAPKRENWKIQRKALILVRLVCDCRAGTWHQPLGKKKHYSWGWRHRPAAPFGLKSGSARTSLHLPAAIMTPCWGWSYYVRSKLGHVGSMLGLRGALLGPCRLMFNQNWDYFAGMFRRNGSIWANFELLLGLCWPMWGLCWGQVCPSRAMLGLWQTGQPDFVSKT